MRIRRADESEAVGVEPDAFLDRESGSQGRPNEVGRCRVVGRRIDLDVVRVEFEVRERIVRREVGVRLRISLELRRLHHLLPARALLHPLLVDRFAASSGVVVSGRNEVNVERPVPSSMTSRR